jgi:hypothetical protein
MAEDLKAAIENLVRQASPEAQKVIAEVFAVEKAKLYISQPFKIVDEVTEAIKEVVQ